MNALTVVPTLKGFTQRGKLFKGITLVSKVEIIFEGFIEPFESGQALGLLNGTAMPGAKLVAGRLKVL